MKIRSAIFIFISVTCILMLGLTSCDMLFGTPVEYTGTGGQITTGVGPAGGARTYQHNYFTINVDSNTTIRTLSKIILTNIYHTSVQDLKITLTAPGGAISMLVLSEEDSGLADDWHFDGTYTFSKNSSEKFDKTNLKSGTTDTLNPSTVYGISQDDVTVFDGIDPSGAWIIDIADGWAGDNGSVSSITLEFYE